MDSLISVRNITKSFVVKDESFAILKDFSVEINKGETVAIVGESGIGKSTLLHIIGTLDPPSDGEVLYNDINPFKLDEKKLAEFRNTKIGFVFQFHYLLPEFQALENVAIPLMIKGCDFKEAFDKSKDLLVKVGLEKRIKSKITDMSGGEQQRVALARALITNPLVLFADEPTGNLDVYNTQKMIDLFLNLNQEMQMTMIIVTHNMDFANTLSRRISIEDGKLLILP